MPRVRKPKLIPEWKTALKHFWSIRFSVVASFLGMAEVFTNIYHPRWVDPGVFAGIASFISACAAVSRMIVQRGGSGVEQPGQPQGMPPPMPQNMPQGAPDGYPRG